MCVLILAFKNKTDPNDFCQGSELEENSNTFQILQLFLGGVN